MKAVGFGGALWTVDAAHFPFTFLLSTELHSPIRVVSSCPGLTMVARAMCV
jgi:hypothetical protein